MLVRYNSVFVPLCSPNTCKDVFNPNVTTFQSNCAEGLHFSAFHCITVISLLLIVLLYLLHLLTLGAHARSEGYCSCPVCVCMCVCMSVRSNLPPHTLESQKRDANGFIAIRERLKKGDFCKNVSFKSYGVMCLPRAAPASYRCFSHASLKPIATFSLHRQRTCGRQQVRFVGTNW